MGLNGFVITKISPTKARMLPKKNIKLAYHNRLETLKVFSVTYVK